jgi:hypothetical protein
MNFSQYQLQDDGVYESLTWWMLVQVPACLLIGGLLYRNWGDVFLRGVLCLFLVFIVGQFLFRRMRPRPVFRVEGAQLMTHLNWMESPKRVALDRLKELSLRGTNENRQLWCTDADGIERRLDNRMWSQDLVTHVERYLQSVKQRLPVPIQFREPSSPYLSQSHS